MGPLPKRRHSTQRKGKRRSQDTLSKAHVKHASPVLHKRSLLSKLKKALGQAIANA